MRMLILMLLMAGAAGADGPVPCPGTPFKTPGEIVHKQDGYELHIWILAKGSRSQGRHGGLLHDGRWVEGKVGQVLDTPIGRVRYAGDFADRQFLWSESGWLPQ